MKSKLKKMALACAALCCLASMSASAEYLNPGQTLTPGQWLDSHDGRYHAILQGDGNFVVYRKSDGVAIWNTGTVGSGATWAVMQGDGNFVIYTSDGHAVWWTGTTNQNGAHANQFVIDDEGMAAVVSYVPVWASNTAIPNLPVAAPLIFQFGFHFEQGKIYEGPNGNQWTFQNDGNLVLYHGGHAIWASNVTANKKGKAIYADWEGVISTWNDDGHVWTSPFSYAYPPGFHQQTGSTFPLYLHADGSYLAIQDDGNISAWIVTRQWGAPNYDQLARNLPPVYGPHCFGDPHVCAGEDIVPKPIITFGF